MTIALLLVVAAGGTLLYSTLRPVPKTVQLTAPAANRDPRESVAAVPKVSPEVQSGYSEKEYALLRQRYKPRPPAASGPLKGAFLEVTEKAVQQDLYPKGSWPLVKAALTGDVTALKNALDTGVTANTTVYLMHPYNANVPLLDFAIWGGQRGAIELLLDHGAALNPAEYGIPSGGPAKMIAPLPYAAEFDEDDVIQLLLDHGADIEQRNDLRADQSTALNMAATGSSPATVYMLLSRGADIRSVLGRDGAVPDYLIHTYPTPNQTAVVNLLVAHGAKIPAKQ
ncbi:MAG TPA: ankyrin repeat domain-containing protein [Steroidobacteraceae bacterium]|nr:ankyrin repeat domain-containing protein [Steroidobacteraceae bacterium]